MPTVTRKINVSCSLAEAWEVLSDFGEISIWARNVLTLAYYPTVKKDWEQREEFKLGILQLLNM